MLHKYVTLEVLRLTLSGRSVRFTQPSCFNDPFEFLPAFHKGSIRKLIRRDFEPKRRTTYASIVDAEFTNGLRNAMTDLDVLTTVSLELCEQYLAQWDLIMGIFCLTAEANHPLMWAHYANSSRGAIISFGTRNAFFGDLRREAHSSGRSEVPAAHRNEFFGDPSREGLNLAKVGYRRRRPVVVIDQGIYRSPVEAFAWKSSEWAYEREYRMFGFMKELKNLGGDPPVFVQPLPPGAITSVTLGHRVLR